MKHDAFSCDLFESILGERVPLTPKIWEGIKSLARVKFDGSEELFNACWRQYRGYVNGATDSPTCMDDVSGWLETIASEKVNNSSSKFYIFG